MQAVQKEQRDSRLLQDVVQPEAPCVVGEADVAHITIRQVRQVVLREAALGGADVAEAWGHTLGENGDDEEGREGEQHASQGEEMAEAAARSEATTGLPGDPARRRSHGKQIVVVIWPSPYKTAEKPEEAVADDHSVKTVTGKKT